MKTVFDLPKPYKESEDSTVYTVHSAEDIFNAILNSLSINPNAKSIKIKSYSKDLLEWSCKFGWDYQIPYHSCNNFAIIQFRGLTRWVYFKNDKPVWFDSAGSGTDTPSHLCGFPNKIYETLDYDRFEKISY